MGKRSKQFETPCSVEFQADDYYGTDIDEAIIGIIKRKIHDIDEDIEEAIKSSSNALKLWTGLSSMFEFALFGNIDNILVESRSVLNSDNDLVIDKHMVYDNYLSDVMSDVVFDLSDYDDKEMLWYIYRYFESIIATAKLEVENGIGKRTQYLGSLNHIAKIFNYIIRKITPIFVFLMMRYGPDEEFDKKATAFIAGKISPDDLWNMGIPIESKLIKGMTKEYIFPFNRSRDFGGLDNWKKMLGKYGKYNKALYDCIRPCDRKDK